MQQQNDYFLQFIEKTDSTNNTCNVCFQEFPEIVNEHYIYKYQKFIQNDSESHLTKTLQQGQILIKCIKCSFICCIACIGDICKSFGECPQRCGLKRNISEQKSTVFKQYNVPILNNIIYNQITGNANIFLLQQKYQLEQNTKQFQTQSLLRRDIRKAKDQTIKRFNEIYIDIETQEIRGFIKDFYSNDYIQLKYPIRLVSSAENLLDKNKISPQEIKLRLIQKFKEDILQMFDFIQKPVKISPFNNLQQSLIQLGYIDFIQNYCFEYSYSDRIIKCSSQITESHDINKPYLNYDINGIMVLNVLKELGSDFMYKVTIYDRSQQQANLDYILSPEEFKSFFAE